MHHAYLPCIAFAALSAWQIRAAQIDPDVLDSFPPEEVMAVLSASNATARAHAEAQCQWRLDYGREWWLVHSELKHVHACYDLLHWSRVYRRMGKSYESNCQENLRELRHQLGPHLWRNRRMPKPIPDEYLSLFREMILPAPELLPPPMSSEP